MLPLSVISGCACDMASCVLNVLLQVLLGAAILGAAASGKFDSLQDAMVRSSRNSAERSSVGMAEINSEREEKGRKPWKVSV